MFKDKEHQRIQALFDDLERLAADARSAAPDIQQELNALRVRLTELEQQIMQGCEKADQPLETPSAGAVLYEKDRVGYAFTHDHIEALQDSIEARPSSQNVLTSPLLIGEEAIGEVQIETPEQHSWTTEEKSLAHAIAQRASLQIQNLRLLAEAERSKVEAESATRRFIHEGWDAYLDAIQHTERIGFTYNQASVAPYTDVLQKTCGVQAPVTVMDEQVGAVYLEPDPKHPLTEAEKTLVSAVADRVAQQVENIRLLADASRARAAAEDAIRHLTRENWKEFAEDNEDAELGFVYDSLQVKPIKEAGVPEQFDLSQPLVVSGEEIGQLAVTGFGKVPSNAVGMLSSIAAQTSIHLETLRLTEELQKRARELKELDRLKSAFLANMSHELRTPLNSILGFTDVMLEGLDGPLTDYMNNDLRLIQKNGQHLLHLINDVLDMAKIESGRMNLHPETFKIQGLLEEVTSITSTLASEKNVSLFIDDDSDHEVEIYADNTRLRQVMINLVNNSIKFTEKGKISICAKPMDGARILITVKDTGIGIPPDKLEAVFQEFTQVDTSTTRKVGGTGLGLPISRRLVEMHGGRLWAESTGVEGEGSTFLVELPVEARITDVIEKKEK